MDDQHEAAAHHLSSGGRIELDGKDGCGFLIDPAAGAEALVAAEHEQPTAEIVHIRAQQAVGLAVDQPARDIGKHDGVEAGEKVAALRERARINDHCLDRCLLERVHKRGGVDSAGRVNDEHLARAVDEGDRGCAVVLKNRVLGLVGGFEDRFETPGSSAFKRERHGDGARPRLELHEKTVAGRIGIKVNSLTALLEEDGSAGGALAAKKEAQIGGLPRSRARRRLEAFEDDLVGRLVFDGHNIDGNPVGLGDLGFGERVADVLVAVRDQHDALGGVGRKNRKRLADAGGDVRRVAVAGVFLVGDDRALVGLREDLGVAADGDCGHAILRFALALDERLRELARLLEQRRGNRTAAVEDECGRERLAAQQERGLSDGAHKRKHDQRSQCETRPPFPRLLAAAATQRKREHRHEEQE